MIHGNKFILSNSVSYNDLADYTISLSPDIGYIPPLTNFKVSGTLMVDEEPYSVGKVADRVGLNLHTKKELQDPILWDKVVKQVQSDIERGKDFLGNNISHSTFKFLLPDRINWRLSNDCFPDSKNYLATFKDRFYLDLVSYIKQQYDLQPFDETFDINKFDNEVNSLLPDEEIIYINDNIVYTVAELLKTQYKILWDLSVDDIYERLYGQPWFIIKELLTTPDVNPWKYIDGNYDRIFIRLEENVLQYMSKAQEKLLQAMNRDGMVVFDMGMLYLYDLPKSIIYYTSTCEKLDIEPNIQKFTDLVEDLRRDYTVGLGKDAIPVRYADIIRSITKVVLNISDVYLDTELRSIRWNILCQIIFRCAINQYNETISLDFINTNTLGNLINNIERQ